MFSDHSSGSLMGACVIEKHFTANTTLDGPDHIHSLNPIDFKQMVFIRKCRWCKKS